jgi:hypothetical protein
MVKSSGTRKKSGTGQLVETELNKIVPGIDKLVEFAAELAESGQAPSREGELGDPAVAEVRQLHKKRNFTAPEAAQVAGKQISTLTKLKLDNVSAVSKKDAGWQVVANLIELSRIPHSTDVLAAYEVQLDAEGNIEGYRRLTRYLRDQVGEDV